MDVGTSALLCTCVLTGGGVALKWISIRVPKSKPSSSNGNGKQSVCPVHGEIIKRLEDGDGRFETQLRLSKSIGKLVIAIAAHSNISIDKIAPELKELIGE